MFTSYFNFIDNMIDNMSAFIAKILPFYRRITFL